MKMRGYRVELHEIDTSLGSAVGTDIVGVIPCLIAKTSLALGIVGFRVRAADDAEYSLIMKDRLDPAACHFRGKVLLQWAQNDAIAIKGALSRTPDFPSPRQRDWLLPKRQGPPQSCIHVRSN
jgi:hypothetical protein